MVFERGGWGTVRLFLYWCRLKEGIEGFRRFSYEFPACFNSARASFF